MFSIVYCVAMCFIKMLNYKHIRSLYTSLRLTAEMTDSDDVIPLIPTDNNTGMVTKLAAWIVYSYS